MIAGVVLAIGAIGYFAMNGDTSVVYATDIAKRGDVVKTVDITGSLTPLSHAELSFQSSGNVAALFVKVGERVRKGQVLASLSAADLSADARRAQADLDLALAGPTTEEIVAAQADIHSAQVAVDNAETALAVTKTVNVANKTNATDAVEKAKEDQTKSAEDSTRDTVSALQDAVIDVRTGLSKADELLGIENTLFNDGFEYEFGAENSQTVQSAQNAFQLAAAYRELSEATLVALSQASYNASLASAIERTMRALEETSDTLLYTRQALDATSANSQNLSLDDLVAYKAAIDTARTNVESARSTLADERDASTQDALTQAHAVRTAEINAEIVNANAQKDEAGAEANVLSTKAALEKAQAAYDKLVAAPRHVDTAPYIASRDAAAARYLKTEIVSPIDGKIGKVNLKLGEAISVGASAISLEPTTAVYEVVVDVPESDVAHLALGDTARMTFDAFGADVEFTGSISSIDRSENVIEGVVFYEARIAVTDGPRMGDLRNGMSVDVTVLTDTRTNAIIVPTRAVLEKDGKKIVRVLVNDVIQEKEVTPGLRGDDGVSEILSGLSEGDVVVVSIKK